MDIRLICPANGAEVPVISDEMKAYIKEPSFGKTENVDWLNLKVGEEDRSFPVKTVFEYLPATDGVIYVSESDNKEKTAAAAYPAKAGRALITNFFIGRTYFWWVEISGVSSEVYTFRTEDIPPRILSVDGISNVRDIGGYYSPVFKKKVRQGLIYRTSELNSHHIITEKGRRTMEDELGVKVDLDVRHEAEDRRPVLDESRVRWINIPLSAYGDIFTDSRKKQYRDSFMLLTDESNFPLFIHCWGGIDRTGTWTYVLGALLGVDSSDLLTEYELSSFSRWGKRSRSSDMFLDFLEKFHAYGDTEYECARNFLIWCGLSAGDIAKIQGHLLTE